MADGDIQQIQFILFVMLHCIALHLYVLCWLLLMIFVDHIILILHSILALQNHERSHVIFHASIWDQFIIKQCFML